MKKNRILAAGIPARRSRFDAKQCPSGNRSVIGVCWRILTGFRSITAGSASQPTFLDLSHVVQGLSIALTSLLIVAAIGCSEHPPASQIATTASGPSDAPPRSKPADPDAGAGNGATVTSPPAPLPDDSQQMGRVLATFNEGAAWMEKYEYAKAARTFMKVLDQAPSWTAARFNLGLAYLNMTGENDPAKRLGPAKEMTAKAIASFEAVVKEAPDNLHAPFCLGMLHSYAGETEKALQYFTQVYEQDSDDNYVAFWYARTLRDLDRHDDAISVFEQIVERDPGFLSAVHQLATLYYRTKRREQGKALNDRFRALNEQELAVGTFAADDKYGMSGKYYFVIDADGLPLPAPKAAPARRILFSPEVRKLDAVARSWKWDGGEISLPALAAADIDNDGDLDVLLGGQDDKGLATLFANDGQGRFSLRAKITGAVVSPCFGDINNDGHVDLWLGRTEGDQVWMNDAAGAFKKASPAGTIAPNTLTSVASLADVDGDGDLDLMAFRWSTGSIPTMDAPEPAASSVFFNNTDTTFVDKAAELGLQFDQTAVAAVVYDDFDNDFDLDMVIFPSHGTPVGWINFRVERYRIVDHSATGLDLTDTISATSGDPDKDGDRDLLVSTKAGIRLFTNDGRFRFHEDEAFTAQCGKLGGTAGQFVDMDNDGDLDIVIGDARRFDGSRGPTLLVNLWPESKFVDAEELDHGILLNAIRTAGDASCVAADFTGDGNCDLLIAPIGQPTMLVVNQTVGGHWIQLDLEGKRPQDKKARSNNSAIGTRVEVRTGALFQQYVVGGSSGPVASLPLRIHVGLGASDKVDWLRIIWPDAILQGEVEVAADRLVTIEEKSRKPASCPYLFAWDGTRFAFVADFGGVGGLGYYLGDGKYASPDPTEYLPVPRLEPLDGYYVLQSLTPLEEITYFDEAKLIAVDHPEGTSVHPNEMMAISVSPPEFELFCIRQPIKPAHAHDQDGRDVTEQLLHIDRRYAGATEPDARFIGLANEHRVELDFDRQLAQLKPDERIVLFLYGWVEYGYSATNYAASQARQRAKAPTIEVFRNGKWVELFREVGYPAGINHMMTVELTGKIRPGDQRIRVSSNMELYWDQIFIGILDSSAAISTKEVAPRAADLHFRGYPREYSPDGRHPNLCDYDNMDRNVAWKLMAGDYTRFGDVRELLDRADDQFVIMGHGEEITLRFAVSDFGPVPAGCVRSFIFKTDSYCKDMDRYTAFPDTVKPLPFHGMSGYPYRPDEEYPDTPETRVYRQRYNTRRIR